MTLTLERIKYKKTEEKPCSIMLSVQVPSDVFVTKQEEVVLEFQRAAQLPGFRTGKVPLELIQKNFSEKIKSHTAEKIIGEIVPQILKEKSLVPVTHPTVDQFKQNNDQSFSFNLIVEYSPEFKVKDYFKIAVDKKIKIISEEDVSKELNQLQEKNAQLVPSQSQKVEKNHHAVIDYSGFAEDKEIPGLKTENQLINLSTPQTIQGFAEGIIGLGKGETKDIPIQFPKEFANKDLAGKSVSFKVTVRDIKEKVLPVLDDEFAKDLGLSSLTELKSKIEESLKNLAERNSDSEIEKQILDYLIKKNPIPVPPSLISMQLESLINHALYRQFGKALEDASKEKLEELKKGLRERSRDQAERMVRISYLINGIAKQENLYATEEEFKAEKERILKSSPNQTQEAEKYFDEHHDRILSQMTEDKIIKFLKDHAKIKEITE